MFIGISGPKCAGKHEAAKYLQEDGFVELELKEEGLGLDSEAGSLVFGSVPELILHATRNWKSHYFVHLNNLSLLKAAAARPFFLHLFVDAPIGVRFNRQKLRDPSISLDEFISSCDANMINEQLFSHLTASTVRVINNYHTVSHFKTGLERLNLRNQTRIRPSWDAYFMQIAEFSSMRSNCMKRRVGCVLVRNSRIIATGYNGTPRGLTNCNDGGCERCNEAQQCGTGLATCLCLHAEENALLEAGHERTKGGIVYCNTCPCLTCTIKLVQSGVIEVVFSQSYSMDTQSAEIFKSAGVKFRQYSPPAVFDILALQ